MSNKDTVFFITNAQSAQRDEHATWREGLGKVVKGGGLRQGWALKDGQEFGKQS